MRLTTCSSTRLHPTNAISSSSPAVAHSVRDWWCARGRPKSNRSFKLSSTVVQHQQESLWGRTGAGGDRLWGRTEAETGHRQRVLQHWWWLTRPEATEVLQSTQILAVFSSVGLSISSFLLSNLKCFQNVFHILVVKVKGHVLAHTLMWTPYSPV